MTWPGRTWVAALLIVVPDALAAQAMGAERSAGIYGYVKDSLDAPVASVVVTLEEAGVSRVTNARGFFVFDNLASGIEVVRFEHLAYEDQEASVPLSPDRATRLVVRLHSAVLELEPLEATVQGSLRLRQIRGFERRREMRSGLFYDVDDLERTTVPRVATLLREVPGLRIDYRALHPPYTRPFAARMWGRPCPILVWIDGRLARRGGETWLRELSPGQVEAVEIYKKGQIPVEFGEASCVVLAIWTR